MDAFIKGHHLKVEVWNYQISASWPAQDSNKSCKKIKILSEILNELLLQQECNNYKMLRNNAIANLFIGYRMIL